MTIQDLINDLTSVEKRGKYFFKNELRGKLLILHKLMNTYKEDYYYSLPEYYLLELDEKDNVLAHKKLE